MNDQPADVKGGSNEQHESSEGDKIEADHFLTRLQGLFRVAFFRSVWLIPPCLYLLQMLIMRKKIVSLFS